MDRYCGQLTDDYMNRYEIIILDETKIKIVKYLKLLQVGKVIPGKKVIKRLSIDKIKRVTLEEFFKYFN